MGFLQLTQKEEEVLRIFWLKGKMFVREVRDLYPTPRPHFNTISTFIRSLESKGYLSHEVDGFSYRYFPVITEEEYSYDKLQSLMKAYFNNSATRVVSTLVDHGLISYDDLRMLGAREKNKK